MLDRSMRRILSPLSVFALFWGLCLASPPAFAQPPVSLDKTLQQVQNLGVRLENSEGERSLLSLLISEANLRSLAVTSIPIADYAAGHSFSSVLEVRIPGSGPGTLVLAVPLAGDVPWGDSAYGIAAAVGLMDRLALAPPSVSVRFAFLGADEALAGSYAYAAYAADESALAVLRLEIGGGLGDWAELLIGGSGILTPYWFLEAGSRILRSEGLRPLVRANRSMIQRLGLTDRRTVLDPWFQKNIPALCLRVDGSKGVRGQKDGSGSVEQEVSLLETFVRSFTAGIPDTWDRQYVLFDAGGLRIAVRETRYIVIVLSIYAVLGFIFVLDSLRRRDILLEDLRRGPRAALALGGVFAALVVCVLAGKTILDLFLRYIEAPGYWMLHPVALSVLRLAQLLTLFLALASLLVRFGILPRRVEFFRGSAIVVLGADILLFSAMRLSLSFLFLWAFMAAVAGRRLGRSTGRAWPGLIALPVSLLPLGFAVSDLVLQPELSAFEHFLFPDWRSLLYLCFVALPFLLLIVALGESLIGSGFYKVRTAVLGAAAFLAVSFGGLAWAYSDAKAFQGPTDISLHEIEDETLGTRRIEISSLRPLPTALLQRPGGEIRLTSSSSLQIEETPSEQNLLTLDESRSYFLDRSQISLTIRYPGEPSGVTIAIPQMTTGSIYDCSYPFKATEDGRGVEVTIGARPPNPLVLDFTVSPAFSAPAYVTVEYHAAPKPFTAEGLVRIREHSVELRAGILLQSGFSSRP